MKAKLINIIGYAVSLNVMVLTLFLMLEMQLMEGIYGVIFVELNPTILIIEIILIFFSVLFISYRMYKESIVFWAIQSKSKLKSKK